MLLFSMLCFSLLEEHVGYQLLSIFPLSPPVLIHTLVFFLSDTLTFSGGLVVRHSTTLRQERFIVFREISIVEENKPKPLNNY